MTYVSLIDGHIDEPRETTRTDFHINVRPYSIDFMCPFCMSHAEVMWDEIDVPDYWAGEWGVIERPECGQWVMLGDYEYD